MAEIFNKIDDLNWSLIVSYQTMERDGVISKETALYLKSVSKVLNKIQNHDISEETLMNMARYHDRKIYGRMRSKELSESDLYNISKVLGQSILNATEAGLKMYRMDLSVVNNFIRKTHKIIASSISINRYIHSQLDEMSKSGIYNFTFEKKKMRKKENRYFWESCTRK